MALGDSTTKQRRDFTRWPIRAIAICAVGMGIGFGLCSVGLIVPPPLDLKDFGAGMLLICLGGLLVSLMWLVVVAAVRTVASTITAIRSDRAEDRSAPPTNDQPQSNEGEQERTYGED